MRKLYIIHAIILIFFISAPGFAQKQKADANIIGHAVCSGKHIPFTNIVVQGITIGTAKDETVHYQLINLPVREVTIATSMVGYITQEKTVTTEANKTLEINFELEEDILNLDEIIVSADRSRQKRVEAPVIVNTISLALFNASQSFTLAEGLNFSPLFSVVWPEYMDLNYSPPV